MKMRDEDGSVTGNEDLNQSHPSEYSDDLEPLTCWECNVNFTSKHYLHKHLFHHIRQPYVRLERTSHLPPLKITLKNTTGNGFKIVNSDDGKLEETEENEREKSEESNLEAPESDIFDGQSSLDGFDAATLDDINGIIENETGGGERRDADADMVQGPIITEINDENADDNESLEKNVSENYDTIPGAEPTPPPDPSPDSYPKIRIKTTGLLKDPPDSRCTITEITDDNSNGDPIKDSSNGSHMWSTPSLEDPLKIHESEDNPILSLFNNNDRAKDFGFTSSDSEYISLDRLDSRTSGGTLQLYNPPTSSSVSSSLESLTGLPMQALAQQVSRLQPSGNGMHQQNVLINIQQFPQPPPQSAYQPPPMYHHSGMSGQPMYQPYQYQPPNPMYYPTGPSYPPPPPPQHMQQPPQMPPHPMVQPPMSQAQIMPPSSQNNSPNQAQTIAQQHQQQQQQHQQQQQQQQQHYRQTMPSRPSAPRPQMPGQRMGAPRQPMMPRGGIMNSRQRAPLTRPRGGMMSSLRGVRPMRMPTGPNQASFRPAGAPVKRAPTVGVDQIKQEQNVIPTKKKRFDFLAPGKDDEDCQVISMQPKNVDGFPQIENVQGGTSDPPENSIMHLSDSITLSVRNPPPKPASPKKSDAKAVANILATRGITVTPTPKPKEKPESPMKNNASPLNLNGAVSIIPSAAQKNKKEPDLPTVDLTDEVTSKAAGGGAGVAAPKKIPTNILPYRCTLCPAQYPNALGLSRHEQTYHKTTGSTNEMGIPLVNLKQPGVLQKLGQLGIFNFIPLPTSQPDGTFAVPIINSRNPGNVQALGASNMLVLGPVKSIPRPNNIRPGMQQKQ